MLFGKQNMLAFVLWKLCLFIVLIKCVDKFVWNFSWLLAMKFIQGNIFYVIHIVHLKLFLTLGNEVHSRKYILCYSYCAFSYIQYINQQMHSIKYNKMQIISSWWISTPVTVTSTYIAFCIVLNFIEWMCRLIFWMKIYIVRIQVIIIMFEKGV